MKICDFERELDLSDPLEIASALTKRYGNGDANEFWLFHDEETYPSLNILVRGDLASLHYYPKARHPGFRSEGNLPGLPRGRRSEFYTNTPQETIEVINDSVVSIEEAVKTALEFARSDELPKSMKWFEL